MPEGGTLAGGGNRETLPGIPQYVDRVSAETIWRQNCDSEVAFMQRRQAKPVRSRENFGALHGFEVIKHPTYISVSRTRAAPGSSAGADARTTAEAASARAPDAGRPASSSSRTAAQAPDPAPMVMPKYMTYSMPHMYELQSNPNRSATSRSLNRVLSTPVVAKCDYL
mmetsp:Transcript_64205/g.173406  ORF Transcript_64205/g.173406 Transcript_64205/m.173406 type:complete len:168 (+) Transcript_64205:101-604(+)